ncbi:MAG: SAM-dependent methyltransferase [Clostridia bacterium]|nr:SAM-dependent methyltransferase [Clostridia bacterium]
MKIDITKLSPDEALAKVLSLVSEKSILKKAVFSKPRDKSVVRMVATLRIIGKKEMLQAEYFMSDNKAIHKNIAFFELYDALLTIIPEFNQVNIMTTAGDCELRRSKSGKSTLIGTNKLLAAISDETEKVALSGNDRKKERILKGDEPFLVLLGVSDENGRIYDKKRSKFNQINRFLEMIRDVEDSLPADEINICDLCCGKSYLSFAAYHYFRNVKGMSVKMYGADLKSDVIEYCSDVAKKLAFEGLRFVCTDINNFEPEWENGKGVDLVISLHACDTATDIVIEKAIEWHARVILSTPCCHHELNHTLNCTALSFIADYSMLKQKLCDAATDALRLKLLEANGYTADALELIDPEETPKNIMLRAVARKNFSKNSPAAKKAALEYEAAKSFLLGK